MKIRYLLLLLYTGILTCMGRKSVKQFFEERRVPKELINCYLNPTHLEVNTLGITALMRAIIINDSEAIDTLFAQTRFDLLAHCDNEDNTLLHYAAFCGNQRVLVHILRLPLEYLEPILNKRNTAGKTAADLAKANGYKNIAAQLKAHILPTQLELTKRNKTHA